MERRQEVAAPLRRVSWGAIFAGAAISTAVMVLLALLGVAIGATITDPATADTPSGTAMAVGAGIWWVVSGIVALMVGGWASGRLAGLRRQLEGPLHGLATWAVTTTALLFLAGSAIGAISSGALQVVSTGSRFVDRDAVSSAVGAHQGRNDATSARGDRTRDGAQAGVTEQEARQAAQTAAEVTAKAAWWAFLFLLLTAAAAGLGGLLGAKPSRSKVHPSQTALRRDALPAT